MESKNEVDIDEVYSSSDDEILEDNPIGTRKLSKSEFLKSGIKLSGRKSLDKQYMTEEDTIPKLTLDSKIKHLVSDVKQVVEDVKDIASDVASEIHELPPHVAIIFGIKKERNV